MAHYIKLNKIINACNEQLVIENLQNMDATCVLRKLEEIPYKKIMLFASVYKMGGGVILMEKEMVLQQWN